MNIQRFHNPFARTGITNLSYSAYKEEKQAKSGVDKFTEEAIEEHKKDIAKEEARRACKGKDGDDFFVKYMRFRDAGQSQGVVENAKAMDDDKDKHILSDARVSSEADDNTDNTQTKSEANSRKKFDNSIFDGNVLSFKTQGGAGLSDAQIQELLNQYDFKAMDYNSAAVFFAELAMNANITHSDIAGIVEDFQDRSDPVALFDVIDNKLQKYMAEYKTLVDAKENEDGSPVTISAADLHTLEGIGNQISSLYGLRQLVSSISN